MPDPFWSRRRSCLGLIAGLAGSGLVARVRANALPNLQDFAAVINLKTGQMGTVINPEQATRIRAQPGSLWKLVTAAAALDAGITNTARRIRCPGWYQPPSHLGLPRLPCWDYRGHGNLTLKQAIARSCNVHFYHLGQELGSERLLAHLHRWDLARSIQTGIAPLLATGEDRHLQTDPWQMLRLIVTIARRGQPLTVQVPTGSETWTGSLLSPQIWQVLTDGMTLAASEGTCRGIAPKGIQVAAKTGTVLNRQRSPDPGRWASDYQAWLGAFWPVADPEWALILHLSQGKAYQAAIPVAREIIDQIERD